jgi:hypothetical protein
MRMANEFKKLVKQLIARTPAPPLLWVIAGNYEQYSCWCIENGISPGDHARVRYVSGPQCLMGHRILWANVRYTGTWSDRPDLRFIHSELNDICNRGAMERIRLDGSESEK